MNDGGPTDAKIDRGFKTLLLSRIFRSVSIIYVTISLPLFLLDLNIQIEYVGIIFFGMISVSSLLSLVSGMIGDRIGYRYSLIIADIPLLFISFVLSLVHNVEIIEIAVILGGVGGVAGGLRGVFAPGMLAMIAKNWTGTQKRISRMGLIMFSGSLASIAGSLFLYAGHFLLPGYKSVTIFRIFYLLMALFAFFSILFVALTPERKSEKKETLLMKRSSGTHTGKVFLTNLIQGSGIGMGLVLLPAWLRIRFSLPNYEIGLIFTFSYVATALGSYISSRRIYKKPVIYYGSLTRVIQGIMLIVMAFLPLSVLVAVAFAVRQFFGGFGAPIRSAINIGGIERQDLGTASSIQGLGMRASQGSSAGAGFLIKVSLPLPVFLGGVMQVIAGYVYFKLLKEK